jgi:hypothetical protein
LNCKIKFISQNKIIFFGGEMDKKKVQGKDIVVNEVPVVGCLTVNVGNEQHTYHVISKKIIPVSDYALKFVVVPELDYFITDDNVLVYDFARTLLVSKATPWTIEYGISPERILVEEYEIEN